MIFFTVGNDHHKFNRFMNIVEDLYHKFEGKEQFFLQYGHTEPPSLPINMAKFLTRDEFEKKIIDSEFIICHGGAGTISQSIQSKKIPIVVPRLYKKNEHLNDHQLDIANNFLRNSMCYVEHEVDKIYELILNKNLEYSEKLKSTKGKLIDSLKKDLEKLL